jgi:hypothetical protein
MMEYPSRSNLNCFIRVLLSARQRVVNSNSTLDCRHPLNGENHYLRWLKWIWTIIPLPCRPIDPSTTDSNRVKGWCAPLHHNQSSVSNLTYLG